MVGGKAGEAVTWPGSAAGGGNFELTFLYVAGSSSLSPAFATPINTMAHLVSLTFAVSGGELAGDSRTRAKGHLGPSNGLSF